MKMLFSLSVISVLITGAANAQSADMLVKKDLRNLNKQEKEIKSEKKEDKKELKGYHRVYKNLAGDKVSFFSKQAFYSDFGNVPDAVWTRVGDFDQVRFMQNGHYVNAYYDADAQLVGTTMHVNFNVLPERAQNYINKKYSGYTKEDVIFFNDNELNETDMVLYGYPFDDADNYFVVLTKGNQKFILRVNPIGEVNYLGKM